MSQYTSGSSANRVADTVLSLENVNVTYDMDTGQARVLDDVSIEIRRDEILGTVGESGSGKSMLASSLLDAVPPPGVAGGTITYYPRDGGQPIDVLDLNTDDLKMFRWEEIAMVFQGAMSSFNPTMKIREHFRETIEAHEMDVVEQMEFARELLRDLYLDPDRVFASYPHELSGGMKQRALIALSLVLDPEVLVMDEPTASLDLLMQRSITNMLSNLRDEYDLTILFITHDLPLVAHLVDRLAVMYAFELIEIGDRDDVLLNGRHPYTRALLRSVPTIDTPVDEMETIEGKSPDPMNVPEGCSYHPRCPLAADICRNQNPEYHSIEEEHAARCFFWEDSEGAIPYTLGESEVNDRE